MPFVTVVGGLTTDYDVVKEKFEWDSNGVLQKVREGNGRSMLKLGFGDQCDYNPNSVAFKEIVWRGTPDRKNRVWMDSPVWRIPTNRWFDLPEEEKSIMWFRLLKFFKLNSNLLHGYKHQETLLFYEPHLDDIAKNQFSTLKKGWHFPLWVLLELKELGLFEQALKRTKVNFQGELSDDFKYMLTQDDYDAIMAAFQERIDEENETKEEANNPDVSVAKKNLANVSRKGNAMKGTEAIKKIANDDPILTEVNAAKQKAKSVTTVGDEK